MILKVHIGTFRGRAFTSLIYRYINACKKTQTWAFLPHVHHIVKSTASHVNSFSLKWTTWDGVDLPGLLHDDQHGHCWSRPGCSQLSATTWATITQYDRLTWSLRPLLPLHLWPWEGSTPSQTLLINIQLISEQILYQQLCCSTLLAHGLTGRFGSRILFSLFVAVFNLFF